MTDNVVRPYRRMIDLPTDAIDLIRMMADEEPMTHRTSFSVEGSIPRDSSVAKASVMRWVNITDHCTEECWEHYCPDSSRHVRTVHLTVEGRQASHRLTRAPRGRYVL